MQTLTPTIQDRIDRLVSDTEPINRTAVLIQALDGASKDEIRAFIAPLGSLSSRLTRDELVAVALKGDTRLIPKNTVELAEAAERQAHGAGRPVWYEIEGVDNQRRIARENCARRIMDDGPEAGAIEFLAVREAELGCWELVGKQLKRNNVPGGVTIFEAVALALHSVERQLLGGPDDGWSGRGVGNVLARAKHEGLRKWRTSYAVQAAMHQCQRTVDEMSR